MQIFNGRTSFFQWDLNQKLIISDTVHNEVHFAHEGDENALVVRVREESGQRVVDVPNILLQTADKIVAYMYGDNETESHTHFYKKFSVKKRPKPDDYVYTETETISFSKIQNEVDDLEGRVKHLEDNPVSDEIVADAVNSYLEENPLESTNVIRHWTAEDLEGDVV